MVFLSYRHHIVFCPTVANVIAESEVNLEPYDDLLESGNAKRDGEALLESGTVVHNPDTFTPGDRLAVQLQ